MSSKGMSLKGRINHYAKQNGIAAQVVLQNYMFERFLERLSRSEYQQKFVIKGGMLVTAIVGIDTRATMDLDTTLRNLPLTEPQIREAKKAEKRKILNTWKTVFPAEMMKYYFHHSSKDSEKYKKDLDFCMKRRNSPGQRMIRICRTG